jgi:hypothetical protein
MLLSTFPREACNIADTISRSTGDPAPAAMRSIGWRISPGRNASVSRWAAGLRARCRSTALIAALRGLPSSRAMPIITRSALAKSVAEYGVVKSSAIFRPASLPIAHARGNLSLYPIKDIFHHAPLVAARRDRSWPRVCYLVGANDKVTPVEAKSRWSHRARRPDRGAQKSAAARDPGAGIRFDLGAMMARRHPPPTRRSQALCDGRRVAG